MTVNACTIHIPQQDFIHYWDLTEKSARAGTPCSFQEWVNLNCGLVIVPHSSLFTQEHGVFKGPEPKTGQSKCHSPLPVSSFMITVCWFRCFIGVTDPLVCVEIKCTWCYQDTEKEAGLVFLSFDQLPDNSVGQSMVLIASKLWV